jgi:signal peptidase I
LLFALLIFGSVAFMICYWFLTYRARVPTGSMMNAIIPGDHVIILRSFGQIERGEIVLFQFPDNSELPEFPKGEFYLCRVVGLPGETIELSGNIVHINGRPLDELRVMAQEDSYPESPLIEGATEGNGPYRVYYTQHSRDPEEEAPGTFATNSPFQIPNGHFFLLGDNRDSSFDSRWRGPVPREMIWGEGVIIYYSEAMTPDQSVRWGRMFKKVH